MTDERTMNAWGHPGRARGLTASLVQRLEDLDRLAAKLGVLAPPVLLRELALLPVELRVADLAVLGLLSSLELRDHGILGLSGCGLGLARRTAKRGGHEPGDHGDEREREHDLHRATG